MPTTRNYENVFDLRVSPFPSVAFTNAPFFNKISIISYISGRSATICSGVTPSFDLSLTHTPFLMSISAVFRSWGCGQQLRAVWSAFSKVNGCWNCCTSWSECFLTRDTSPIRQACSNVCPRYSYANLSCNWREPAKSIADLEWQLRSVGSAPCASSSEQTSTRDFWAASWSAVNCQRSVATQSHQTFKCMHIH